MQIIVYLLTKRKKTESAKTVRFEVTQSPPLSLSRCLVLSEHGWF